MHNITCMCAATCAISTTDVEDILLLPSFCVEPTPSGLLCVVCKPMGLSLVTLIEVMGWDLDGTALDSSLLIMLCRTEAVGVG